MIVPYASPSDHTPPPKYQRHINDSDISQLWIIDQNWTVMNNLSFKHYHLKLLYDRNIQMYNFNRIIYQENLLLFGVNC